MGIFTRVPKPTVLTEDVVEDLDSPGERVYEAPAGPPTDYDAEHSNLGEPEDG